MRIRFLAVAALVFAAAPALAEEKRVALLIGNSDYPAEVGRLQLPAQDVEHMRGALQDVGFQVDVKLDLDEDGMEAALSDFETRINFEAADGDDVVAFFYYSGHGASAVIQGARKNYLLPAKERITSASELARKGVELDDVITGLSLTRADGVFVVADACRNDLAAAFGRSADKGFAAVPARPGMFIAHSTYPGQTAPDDGAFARTLAANIRKPNLFSERVFALTNREVAASRGLDQIPTTAGALNKDFCFNGCPGEAGGAATPVASQPPVSRPPASAPPQQRPLPPPPEPEPRSYGDQMKVQPGLWTTTTVANATMTMANGMMMPVPEQRQTESECITADDNDFNAENLFSDNQNCSVVASYVSGRNLTADVECVENGMTSYGAFDLNLNAAGTRVTGTAELRGETPGVGTIDMQGRIESRRTGPC